MRMIVLSAALILVSGAALAQEGAPTPPASGGAAPAAATPNPNAYVIKPGSTITVRGENGFGGGAPVPGLYRDNPGNGFYGAYSGGGF